MEAKLKEIFIGFKNLIFPNQQIESVAEERLKICFNCPVRTDDFCDKNKSIDNVKGCGCYLKAKVRSTGECPLKKW